MDDVYFDEITGKLIIREVHTLNQSQNIHFFRTTETVETLRAREVREMCLIEKWTTLMENLMLMKK